MLESEVWVGLWSLVFDAIFKNIPDMWWWCLNGVESGSTLRQTNLKMGL